MSWTDERVELLRKLWLEGLSASQIANELANGLTRNAVIGKVHRLGLSGRVKTNAAASIEEEPQQAQVKQPQRSADPRPGVPPIIGNTALAFKPVPIEAPAPLPSEDVVIPLSERVTIMELREAMCRWPLGDPTLPEFRFCGARKPLGEGPYCAYHAGVAYQPQQDRRRDRRMQRPA